MDDIDDELDLTSGRKTSDSTLRPAARRRMRAGKVVAATHLFGDPNGWSDPEVEHMLTESRGRRSR